MTDHEKTLIALLLPEVQIPYLEYRLDLESQGLRECVIQTVRTVEEQAKKQSTGRSTQKIGWHNLRRGIDRQVWDPKAAKWDADARRPELYFQANQIAEAHGFRQIGFHPDGTKRYIGNGIWDPYHVEWRKPWDTLTAAIESEAPELVHLA